MNTSSSMTGNIPPKVFISYSHEGPEHDQKVVDLAGKLRGWGIDAWIDRYEPHPEEGWPRWMTHQIEKAAYVLLVCTETYRRRFEGKEEPGKGKGVTWEGLVANQVLYEDGSLNKKCIAVQFEKNEAAIPIIIKPFTYYLMPDDFENLYRHLTDQPEIEPPGLGQKRTLGSSKTLKKTLPKVAVRSIGVPEQSIDHSPFFPGPPVNHCDAFFGRKRELVEVQDALNIKQSIQIIGEARMGKTSLLNRIAEDLLPNDRPVVRINAQDVACATPACLVGYIAKKLERKLNDFTNVTEDVLVCEAFKNLTPFALVLDEADRLAKAGHQFTQVFFSQCRSLCQDKSITWISTSRKDLQIAFLQTGLNSDFLNDSRRIFIGHLEKTAAKKLLAILGPEKRSKIMEQTGGFPDGLQWLGDAWWRHPDMDAERLADEYANAMRPTFLRWWRHCDELEKILLKKALHRIHKSSLSRKDRLKLRKLVKQGLAAEDEGFFFYIPGKAWQEYVIDAR